MILLILGVLLWASTHSMKHFAPKVRKGLGEAQAKGLVAGAALVAILLMVIGYRSADYIPVYDLGPDTVYLNNILMVIAVALVMAGTAKSRITKMMRHPMLVGLILWVCAHLLVAGEAAPLVLFGGMAAWAVMSMVLINRAEPVWTPPASSTKGDLILLVLTVVLVAAVGGIHMALGLAPFGVSTT